MTPTSADVNYTFRVAQIEQLKVYGDVQAGSVKRVASAVEQGFVVVSQIHRATEEESESFNA